MLWFPSSSSQPSHECTLAHGCSIRRLTRDALPLAVSPRGARRQGEAKEALGSRFHPRRARRSDARQFRPKDARRPCRPRWPPPAFLPLRTFTSQPANKSKETRKHRHTQTYTHKNRLVRTHAGDSGLAFSTHPRAGQANITSARLDVSKYELAQLTRPQLTASSEKQRARIASQPRVHYGRSFQEDKGRIRLVPPVVSSLEDPARGEARRGALRRCYRPVLV